MVRTNTSVCKDWTGGDLLERALARIGRHLFLTRERLDHFLGIEKLSRSFVMNHIYPNWEAYIRDRGVDMFERCAVVGNSGHLLLKSYGHTIDSFDAIMRTNQAPVKGYEAKVGNRTTFRLINRSMSRRYQEALETRYKRLRDAKAWIKQRMAMHMKMRTPRSMQNISGGDPTLEELAKSTALRNLGVTPEMLASVPIEPQIIEQLQSVLNGVGKSHVKVNNSHFPLETNVTAILVAEATTLSSEIEGFTRAVKKLRPDVNVVVYSGKTRLIVEDMLDNWYTQLVACHGIRPPEGQGARATSGILATMVMMRQCKHVTLFGFGPAAKGLESAPYHYYSGLMSRTHETASTGVHFFSGEHQLLLSWKNEGRITICNELSPDDCGAADDASSKTRVQKLNQG